MYRSRRAHSGLAGWIHTRTRQIDPSIPHTSDAPPGDPHNDWSYDAVRGGWLYKGSEYFTPGGPTAPHGGWDFDGKGAVAVTTTPTTTTPTDVVVTDSDGVVLEASMGGGLSRNAMLAAGAVAVWFLFFRK